MNRAIQYREGCVSDNESRSGIQGSYRTLLKSVGWEKTGFFVKRGNIILPSREMKGR